jgi:NAD+ synthase
MAKAERIALWMRSQLSSAGARGLLVGLSGGVDSAVVARLAQMAAPGAVTGILLPCHSDPQDESDAQSVASHFSLPTMRIDLSASYDVLVAEAQAALRALPESVRVTPADGLRGRVPLANIKPRLRMTALYFIANSINYLVAGTGNRSELAWLLHEMATAARSAAAWSSLKREVREMAGSLACRGHHRSAACAVWIARSTRRRWASRA